MKSFGLDPQQQSGTGIGSEKGGWILHVPSTLPDEEHPYRGIFKRAHIDCASRYVTQRVYYAYTLEKRILRSLARNEERTCNGPTHRYAETLRRYPRMLAWQLWALLELFAWLKKRRHAIRLLHAHGTVWAGIWCAILGRWFKIPVLVSEHSSAFPLRNHPFLIRQLARCLLPCVQAILPVTQNLGRAIRCCARSVPQHVVPNSVDTDYFAPTNFPPPQPLQVLFVGSLVPVKRVDLLLQACARLQAERRIQLRLAGAGPLAEPLHALATSLGLGEAARFLGTISREQVREEMRQCHIVVLASAYESQPCVLIEAMLSGRPVIAPSVGGIPELGVDDTCGVLFEPGSVDDLTRAIRNLAEALPRLSPDGISARCRSRFSYETVGRILVELYERYQRT